MILHILVNFIYNLYVLYTFVKSDILLITCPILSCFMNTCGIHYDNCVFIVCFLKSLLFYLNFAEHMKGHLMASPKYQIQCNNMPCHLSCDFCSHCVM